MLTSTLFARPVDQIAADSAHLCWLWRPYLAAGKLTILDGDPGSGKSMITIDLAARLSRAAPLPDGTSPPAPCTTLLLNSEDSPADTLLPRLKAAGADTNLVFVANANELPQLPDDLPKLEALVRELSIGLVVIDPLTGFVPPNHANAGQNAARLAVAPLVHLADRTGAAILLVRHLTKKEGAPAIRRGLGSMSIAGLARTALIVGRDPGNPAVSLLAVTKTNLTAVPDPLAFCLAPRDNSVVVDWRGPVAVRADDACRHPKRAEVPGIVKATLWLMDALAHGPRHAAELLAAAKAEGIGEITLYRARHSLNVKSKFTRVPGEPRAWLWCPPADEFKSCLEPLGFELEPLEDPIRQDLPKNMSQATQDILAHERLAWASKNLRPTK